MAIISCPECRAQISDTAKYCPSCGARPPGGSDKLIVVAAILCFFFGVFGIHRFYVGKVGTGLLQIITLGGFGIWYLVDLIMILIGKFRDKQGNLLTQWT